MRKPKKRRYVTAEHLAAVMPFNVKVIGWSELTSSFLFAVTALDWSIGVGEAKWEVKRATASSEKRKKTKQDTASTSKNLHSNQATRDDDPDMILH